MRQHLLIRLKIYGYHHNLPYQRVVMQLYFLLQMVLETFSTKLGWEQKKKQIHLIQYDYIGVYILKEIKIGEMNKRYYLGVKGAAQECDCDFVSSGDTVIDPQLLMFYKESFVQEPMEKTGFDGNLWKWEYPNYTLNLIWL